MAGKKRTHCNKGHELKEPNLIINKKTGKRKCKICDINYRNDNKEKILARSAKWRLDNIERAREIERKHDKKRYPERVVYRKVKWWVPYNHQLKLETLTHYGNGKLVCVCCGINKIQFLTLDHINGRDKHEKKNPMKRGANLWQHLRARNFPEGYQTLCWNCNCARAFNKGICPHKLEE